MKLFCFGLGYSAQRLHQLYHDRFETFSGSVRSADKATALRQSGIDAHTYAGGAPSPAFLKALMEADALLVSAAPGEQGDPMLQTMQSTLLSSQKLRLILYWSTVGVYGDHGGAWIDETAPLKALSQRGQRRVEAETAWQALADQKGIALQIHRLAGIYGPGRSAIDDIRAGTARRIIKGGQVFNRIHVDDIAGATMAGLSQPDTKGAYNICDDEPCPPQDVVSFAADLLGKPHPPAIPFEQAALSEMGRSFYAESKRCSNQLLKTGLKYNLQFPTYRQGLTSLARSSA